MSDEPIFDFCGSWLRNTSRVLQCSFSYVFSWQPVSPGVIPLNSPKYRCSCSDHKTQSYFVSVYFHSIQTAGLKLWKKDYDRVITLAKGAYGSTTVKEIQAESLFLLARVYHVRDDKENASKFYDKACKLAPNLSPARFGLAQTLIWDEKYDEAAAHLRLVLGSSPNATDSLAALGLLEVKTGKDRQKAFSSLKKATDLDVRIKLLLYFST